MVNKKHILVVEDEPILQRTIRRVLEPQNIVTVAPSAEAAIALLEGVEFDVILSDYNLADRMTGEDLLNWIKTHRPDAVDRFIFYSGNNRVLEIHPRVVLKPAFNDELRQAVDAVAR